jgi:hypothetical protein
MTILSYCLALDGTELEAKGEGKKDPNDNDSTSKETGSTKGISIHLINRGNIFE